MAARKFPRTLVITLVLVLLIISVGAAGIGVVQQAGAAQTSTTMSGAATPHGSLQQAPVSPAWTQYKDDVAAGRHAKQTEAGHGLGAVPGIVDTSHL